MLLHMPDYLVDRIQHTDVTPLRSNPLHQPLGRHRSNNPICLRHGSRELLHQLSATQTIRRTELRIPHPNILSPTHPMHNPLPHISAKMKHKITDSILMSPMPLPNLRIRQFTQTNSQVLRHPIQLLARVIQKQSSNRVVHEEHSNAQIRPQSLTGEESVDASIAKTKEGVSHKLYRYSFDIDKSLVISVGAVEEVDLSLVEAEELITLMLQCE